MPTKGHAVEDVLGPDYIQQTLDLSGGNVATLVRLPANPDAEPKGAMLYLHGFVDYFFQDHVARHFAEQGWAWYAVDLRRYGRSLRPDDEPWFTTDLTEYYEELDRTVEQIRADGHTRIVLMGHSTGGLISSLWAHDRRDSQPADALVLNSPWLDLQQPWIIRTLGTWIIRGVGAVRPMANVPQRLEGVYAQSIHQSARGEWDFDPAWKPLTAQPVKTGFLAAVRREQARLHKGLFVNVPVLMLHSHKSLLGLTEWDDAAHSADLVLDVEQMKEWLPAIGPDTTAVELSGARHDVMLSIKPVRERALQEVDSWLRALFS